MHLVLSFELKASFPDTVILLQGK